MDTELNEQVVDAEAGAVPTGTGAEAATSSEATTEGQGAPDIKAQIDEAVQAAIREYEGEGGHLARLRSKKDKEIAKLQRQLRQQRTSKVEEAKALVESNPEQAAQILLGLAAEQDQQVAQDTAHQELVEWQYKILTDLGADPNEDEEAAELATEWAGRLIEDPRLTWDFQQAAARLQLERKNQAIKDATKELKELRDGLDDTVNAAVTRALVQAGIVPEPTGDGEPATNDDNWRQNPNVSRGLEKRMKRPIQRV